MTQSAEFNFSHVGICVSDKERSLRFYTEGLGFTVTQSLEVGAPFHIISELPELKLYAIFMIRDGVSVELLYHERPAAIGLAERRPMNQLGLTHLSFTVNDLAAAANRIVKFGGYAYAHTKVTSPAGDMMFCTDPDGVRIELWQKTV